MSLEEADKSKYHGHSRVDATDTSLSVKQGAYEVEMIWKLLV